MYGFYPLTSDNYVVICRLALKHFTSPLPRVSDKRQCGSYAIFLQGCKRPYNFYIFTIHLLLPPDLLFVSLCQAGWLVSCVVCRSMLRWRLAEFRKSASDVCLCISVCGRSPVAISYFECDSFPTSPWPLGGHTWYTANSNKTKTCQSKTVWANNVPGMRCHVRIVKKVLCKTLEPL